MRLLAFSIYGKGNWKCWERMVLYVEEMPLVETYLPTPSQYLLHPDLLEGRTPSSVN